MVAKKSTGGGIGRRNWTPETPEQKALRIQAYEDKRDETVNNFGQPDYILKSKGENTNVYYWFDQKFKLQKLTILRIKIKKKYVYWGEEAIYDYGEFREDDEIQVAYQMHKAEKILLGEL